jgi:hypothetical protein
MKLLLCVALAAVVCLHAVQADAQNAQKVSEWSDKSQASAVAASSNSNDVPSRQERAAKETKKEKKEKKVRGENRAWPRTGCLSLSLSHTGGRNLHIDWLISQNIRMCWKTLPTGGCIALPWNEITTWSAQCLLPTWCAPGWILTGVEGKVNSAHIVYDGFWRSLLHCSRQLQICEGSLERVWSQDQHEDQIVHPEEGRRRQLRCHQDHWEEMQKGKVR